MQARAKGAGTAGKRDLDPGASPLHFFGAEVRRAREAAGMTLAELGTRVPCDASTVSRVESGLLSPSEALPRGASRDLILKVAGEYGRDLEEVQLQRR
jgi:transcriptional regulator with XRE-family HTH domain